MKFDSKSFEKQIHRIHELIEQKGSVVTWDDHLPDPDNPDQPRQIDITVKYDGRFTLIECRIHKKKQDVKWIEELMGRRISLRADSVIAVSASGFTSGAAKKAESHGIIIRDFHSLTVDEIRAWGKTTKIHLSYLQYNNVVLNFSLRPKNQQQLNPEDFKKEAMSTPNLIYALFDGVAKSIDDIGNGRLKKQKNITATFRYPNETVIAGFIVNDVIFSGEVKRINQKINVPAVFVYENSECRGLEHEALVEKVNLGESEVIQSGNNVRVSIDFSAIKHPPNSQFRTVHFDFKRPVCMTAFQPLGLNRLSVNIDQIRFLARL